MRVKSNYIGNTRTKSIYADYPMPTGPYWDKLKEQHDNLKKDPRYQYAKSCVYCTDTSDGFNRYISTYCHQKRVHMAGFGDKDCLDMCSGCAEYRRREQA